MIVDRLHTKQQKIKGNCLRFRFLEVAPPLLQVEELLLRILKEPGNIFFPRKKKKD